MRNTYKHLKLRLACLLMLSSLFCSAQFTTLAIQDFDTIKTPVLGYSVTGGGPIKFRKGLTAANAIIPSSPYGMNNSWAWYSESEDITVTFDNVNISGYDTAYITFKLAAMFEVDMGDYVLISVSTNGGTTWYDRVRINGYGTGNTNCSWAYNATGVVDHLFAPVNTTTTYTPPAAGVSTAGPSTIQIRVPNATNQVRVKIRHRESAAESYYVDDVAVKVRAATSDNAALLGLVAPFDFCPGSHDVKVKIANKGQNIINNVTVNWSLNGMGQSPFYYSLPLDTIGGTGKNTDTITLTNLFFGAGTTSNIKVWTSDPNNMPDGFPSDDTMSFTLRPSLNGVYTVGGSTPDYPTLTAAVADLNLYGVCGPVKFNVAPGTYTGQLNIGNVKGASSVNTIDFVGTPTPGSVITASAANGTTLILAESRYVTFRDFTIQNTVGTNGTAVALVGSTNRCTIKNCIINLSGTGTTYGIASTGTASGHGVTNNFGDSIQVDSNTVNAYYGIYLYGNSVSPSNTLNRDFKIRNNIVNARAGGINVTYVYNALTISGNTINMNPAGPQSSYGISVSNSVNSISSNAHEISYNRIKNAGMFGITMATVTNPAGNPGRIFNNMVGGSFRSPNANGITITESSSSPSLIYHNSVILDYSQAAKEQAALYYSGAAGTKVKNNIFAYTATSGLGVPVYFNTSPTTGNISNNMYYNAAGSTLIYKGGTAYTDANYRMPIAGGDSSYNKRPSYTSATDLHVADACVRGTNLLSLISTDIDGDPRSVYPIIGADEMVAQPDNISVDAITSPQAGFTPGMSDITAVVRNNGSNTVYSFYLTYVLNNGLPVTQLWNNGFLNPCDTVSVVFSGFNQANLTAQNVLAVYTSLPNGFTDAYPLNDTMKINLSAPLSGTYTIGPAPSDFVTFNEAITALKVGGVGGHVIFDVKTSGYNEMITIYDKIRGISDTSTVTFRSSAAHRDSVLLTYSSSNFPVITLANTNYLTFKDMTIEATDANFGRVIEFAGTTSYITIEGCKIKGVSSGSYETVYGTALNGKRLLFKNNLITDGYYGMYLYADANATNVTVDSIILEGNTFQNTGYCGVDLYYVKNAKVRNNTFTGNIEYCVSSDQMYDAYEITGNKINTTGSHGLYMYYNYGTASAGALIANNSIRVAGDYGIRNYYGSYQKFYNNSVSVTGRYPIWVNYNSSATNNEWRNNVSHSSGTTSTSYAAYITSTSATNTWNYNLYYTASTSTFIYFGQAYTTLAAYRTAQPAQDVNSFNAIPAFTSATDLAPLVTNVNSWYMNGRGIQTINDKDVNGNARSTTLAAGAPDIGAYEFTPRVAPPVATASPANPAAGTTQVFTLLNDTLATIEWAAASVVPTSISVRFYSGEFAPNTSVSHYRTNCYWDIQETGPGLYSYTANLYYKNPMLGTIPVEADMRLAKMHNTDPWTLYTGTQSSAEVNRNILSAPGLTDFSVFTGTDNTNPLPVKLLSLKAAKSNNDALIAWTTASEANNKGFEVQRSADGKQFETIGFVKGAGTSGSVKRYSFTDANVFIAQQPAVFYYRLNQLDHNGDSWLSHVVIVDNNTTLIPGITLYPNPFSSQVTLTVSSASETIAAVQVFDINGRLISATDKALGRGENIIPLDETAAWDKGLYFVHVTLNGEKSVIKLLKQ